MFADVIENTRLKLSKVPEKIYWEFYGLEHDPFIHTRELYLPSRWEQYFDLLNHYCYTTNVLLSITGMKSVGKSSFAECYLTQLRDEPQVCHFNGTADLKVAELIARVVRNFSLPSVAGLTLEEQLDSCLANLQHHQQLCLLVIDNAHELSPAVLQTLLYWIRHQSDSQMRLHILLFGLPELERKLTELTQREGENELVTHLDIIPFNVEETEAYLRHRLSQAGLPAALPFTLTNITKIQSLSKGIPHEIDKLAKQMLMAASKGQNLKTITGFIEGHQTEVLGAAVLFAALLLGVVFFAKNSHYHSAYQMGALAPTSYEALTEQVPEKNVISTTIVIKQEKSAPRAAYDENQKIVINSIKASASAVAEVAVKQMQLISAPKSAPVVVPAESNAPLILSRAKVDKQELATTLKLTTAVVARAEERSDGPRVLPTTAIAQNEQVLLEASTHTKSSSVATTDLRKDPAKLPATKSNKPDSIAKSNMGARQRSAPINLLGLNPQRYMLQLIGLSSENAMRTFITQNNLSKNVVYYHSHLQGKDWFVLLYGNFASPEEAKAAVARLPAAVQAQKPWVRKVANVHDSLRRIG